MTVSHVRSLSLIVIAVCLTACQSTIATDPRGELLRAINGANAAGYTFSFDDDGSRSVSALTNPAVNDVVTVAAGDSSIPIRYTTIRDRATNTSTTYKAELVRSGKSVSFVVTDIATNREVQRASFSDDDNGGERPPVGGSCDFHSCTDAENDYKCNQEPRLRCEANGDCKTRFGHYTCDSVIPNACDHYTTIVVPTSPRCASLNTVTDIDKLVLRRSDGP
jgi:hypothetical protein